MSLTNYVPSRGRVYVRLFDHDEARERHAAGETIRELEEAYGVTYSAVRRVVVAGVAELQAEYARAWRTGVCEGCGGDACRLVAGKHNIDGRVLCSRCRGVASRTAVRLDEAGRAVGVRCANRDCVTGERWQPPRNFGRGKRFSDLRPGGFHSQCRACLIRARQVYREKRKVPCETCGAPCLPPSEKTTNGSNRPRCRKCFIEWQHPNRRASAEAVPHHPSRPERRA